MYECARVAIGIAYRAATSPGHVSPDVQTGERTVVSGLACGLACILRVCIGRVCIAYRAGTLQPPAPYVHGWQRSLTSSVCFFVVASSTIVSPSASAERTSSFWSLAER